MRTTLLALLLVLVLGAPAAAHDVNGDGLADVVTSDLIDSVDSDGATVVFGAADRSAPPSLKEPGARGFRITVSPDDDLGGDLEVIGDVNGDGLADILANGTGGAPIYVVFGKADTAPVVLEQDKAKRIEIEADGVFMSGAGDVNGDKLADLAHVRFGGKALARVRLGAKTKPLTKSFDIVGAGRVRRIINPQLAAAGDVNDDGLDDVAVAIADPDGRVDGFDVEEMVAVVFGKKDRRTVTVSQARAGGPIDVRSGGKPAGFAIRHVGRTCECSVSEMGPVGDLNGDGRGDLGVLWSNPYKANGDRLDLVHGRTATSTLAFPGAGGASVRSVSAYQPFGALGDLDGDDRDDLLVAAEKGRSGLQLLSGKKAKGSFSLPAKGKLYVKGLHGLAESPGDFDGDGAHDLLLGRNEIELAIGAVDPYWVLFGKSPLTPVDLAKPGAGLLRLG